ncbi:hypothetical protein HML84_10480 [Alcanivorax sp. IO_7]|nr:hypothetical protein HML84_10480 [Alcanivorax sp. IO_7]
MKLDNGFLDFDPVHLAPTGHGPLDGLRFAAKDVYDIAGTVTGIGHPCTGTPMLPPSTPHR